MRNPFLDKDYGLYIHIPFCSHKCNYCAFNVNIMKNISEEKYLNKLNEEILHHGDKKFKTIYIGGGTPNLLSNKFYTKLFENINIDSIEEITIELNPEFVTKEQIEFYKSLGVNRFSLGVQTFDENGLVVLGRNHSNKEALKAIEILKNENYSFDLIYGYPSQTIESLKQDLEFIKKINPNHLSIYNLSYEKGAFFYKWKKDGKIEALGDEIELKMYNLINQELSKIGLKRYEISNFAKEGKSSKHNMLYWTSHPYIGIGTAAHSYYYDNGNIIRSEKESKLRKYISVSLDNLERVNILDEKEYIFDKFYSEMRKLYIDTDEFLLQTGVDLFNITLQEPFSSFNSMQNFIEARGRRLCLTDLGVINSDTVFEYFYDILIG